MKKDLLNILACPVCKGPLDLRATREDNDNIIEGALHLRTMQPRLSNRGLYTQSSPAQP